MSADDQMGPSGRAEPRHGEGGAGRVSTVTQGQGQSAVAGVGGGDAEGGCYMNFTSIKKKKSLAGVAQWTECRPANQKVTGLIPSQGTCLGCGPDPEVAHARGY